MYKKLSNLLSKLVVLNSLVILLVILLAGLSVKDYACFLVNSKNITGPDFVQTLNGFLLRVSILAFIIVGLFHYFIVRKIVQPIKLLSKAAKDIKEGNNPVELKIKASGELKELTENFNSMAKVLSSTEKNREEMLKDIAHELRTPLTNMNGYLEALQNGVIKGDPELFGSLLEESCRITRIVELITELHSWSNGNFFSEKQFKHLEIDKVLKEAITVFHLKMQRQFINIEFHADKAAILGNRDGLTQVFTNIIQNILDYDTGKTVKINGIVINQTFRISFTHTGQFIDPEKKDLIFERFYRLEESRSTKAAGAGLGLAIAKSIIAAHKGIIGLKTDGVNHIFWIELPLASS
ncbi:HAMP domain-containing sensor histidine kinase [Metabacillus fastidiosus]|uniref:HAMP domain-containing sensor histidine kinase n=1 Tax=Metabacillus fastidiosus TaxID=1458 RepID=UPI003D2817D0